MHIIGILDDCFSNGEALAERIAELFGYRSVEDQVVIGRAAALGFSHQELRDILESFSTLFGDFTHERRTLLAAIQAALAREVQGGNLVCRANLAYLLPAGLHDVLRVRIMAPRHVRVQAAQDRLRLSRSEAITYIRKRDKARARWIRTVYSASGVDPSLCDIVINFGSVSIEEATDTLANHILGSAQLASPEPRHDEFDDWVVSTLVTAELALDPATRGLELDVAAECGSVSIKGRVESIDECATIKRVAAQVPEVIELNLDRLDIGRSNLLLQPEVVPFHQKDEGRPVPRRLGFWPAWAMIGALLCFVIVYASLVNKGVSELARVLLPASAPEVRMFSGTITDTKCGLRHGHTGGESESECVKACVKGDPATKYALDDGQRVYVLSDQRTPSIFAAHQVMVVGTLDERTNKLSVRSIELVL